MCQDSFLHNSWKTPPSNVERGFWGRVQQPLCFISPGMFIYLASIKHCEVWNYTPSNSECLQSKTRSICFLCGYQGNRRQELLLSVPRKTEVWTDLSNIYENYIRAQLHPGEMLSHHSQLFLSPFFRVRSKASLFSFANSFLPRSHLCFSPPSPLTIFLDPVWSEVNPVASLPAVQCLSHYLPLDCVQHR